MKILFLGKPGSGKGVYSQRLRDDFKFNIISTGELLRKEIRKKSKLGLKIKKRLEQGLFANDKIVFELLLKAIKGKKFYILDGFPRDLKQAKLFKEKIDKVIYLDVSDKNVIERLGNRVICSKCSRIYNLLTIKPKKKGICDLCGSKLIKREDEKFVRKRLQVYKKETKPLIDYYNKKKLLKKFNGNRHYKIIYKEIKSYIKKLINK